jgi:hypothetical protein
MAKTRLIQALITGAVLVGQGCLLDIPPRQEPLDELWKRWMLEERYGRWKNGKELAWERPSAETIHSYPEGASRTRFGIDVSETRSTNAGWHLEGGLIGRIQLPDFSIDLFGRETTRIHGPTYAAEVGRDHTYEFFLVVRSRGASQGRAVRQWRFPPKELAMTGDPVDPAIFQRSTRSRHADVADILDPPRGAYPRHFIDGYLDFDPATKTATVTVTGLKRPFQDQVDLSNELPP